MGVLVDHDEDCDELEEIADLSEGPAATLLQELCSLHSADPGDVLVEEASCLLVCMWPPSLPEAAL